MCAAVEHGIIDALAAADIAAFADTAYQAADPAIQLGSGGAVLDPDRPLRRLYIIRKQVNATHARQQRGHGVEDIASMFPQASSMLAVDFIPRRLRVGYSSV